MRLWSTTSRLAIWLVARPGFGQGKHHYSYVDAFHNPPRPRVHADCEAGESVGLHQFAAQRRSNPVAVVSALVTPVLELHHGDAQ